jgi:predicted deacylase
MAKRSRKTVVSSREPQAGPPEPVHLVSKLDLEALPAQRRTRLMLALVTDGLGQPIRVPVIVAKGRRPGPVLGLTSALHGNELNGIAVLHRLLDRLDLARLRGTVVCVIVANVPGYERAQRGYAEGTDLNHVMPGKRDGTAAQVYAHRLIDRIGLADFDYLVDLHTASFGRINSLYVRADLHNEKAAEMARALRPQIIVHNPASDYTLRGTAAELGVPAITVEIADPQRFQPRYIKTTESGLDAILAMAGMLARRQRSQSVAAPVICKRSYWLYTDHGGLLTVTADLAQEVEARAPVADLHDIFGDATRHYSAPEAGIVVGKSIDPVARTGDRILHLGVIGEPSKQS